MSLEAVTDTRTELGEGPSWDSVNQVLYWVDIAKGLIHVYRPDNRKDDSIQVGNHVSSVVPRKTGSLVATLQHGFFSVDLKERKVSPISQEVESELVGNRFNDGKCDPAGRFWAGTMDIQEKNASGSLYFLDRNKSIHKILSNIFVSNGLGWSPDNNTMYYIDTPTMKVSAFDYSLKTGQIENKRTVVDLVEQKQPGFPDGMAVDEEGMIWVAHWGGSRVTRWDPAKGNLLQTLPVPALQVTSCCFGGKDLDELYVTTARDGLDQMTLAKQPLTGSLFMTKVGVRGLPTNAFDG